MKRAVIALMLGLALAACGHRGPLIPPQDAKPMPVHAG